MVWFTPGPAGCCSASAPSFLLLILLYVCIYFFFYFFYCMYVCLNLNVVHHVLSIVLMYTTLHLLYNPIMQCFSFSSCMNDNDEAE